MCPSRFSSVKFFPGVIVSVHALEIYGSYVSAAAFTVIGGTGILICAGTLGHSAYSWFLGYLSRTDFPPSDASCRAESRLSTLV